MGILEYLTCCSIVVTESCFFPFLDGEHVKITWAFGSFTALERDITSHVHCDLFFYIELDARACGA